MNTPFPPTLDYLSRNIRIGDRVTTILPSGLRFTGDVVDVVRCPEYRNLPVVVVESNGTRMTTDTVEIYIWIPQEYLRGDA